MAHRHNGNQWDDQELHKLFAARLPILAIPDDFAERLTLSVLEEVVRHVEKKRDPGAATFDERCAEASGSELASCTECTPSSAARRRRVPPAIL